ncbi:MAG: ATP-binding cassette domain-containing protein [Actinomycetota bacterium]|nr:ATP-binding cassette domain-containing protein [Actinomycetota bacterium]
MSNTGPSADGAAIVASELVRCFDDVRAVDGVNLEVATGEIYGFLGPNGAGKSTMMRMLCTLLAPTSGQARVAGYDVVKDSGAVRLRIGLALQDAALDPKLTGREVLVLQGRYYGLRRDEIAERVASLEPLIDIGDALDRQIRTYSGGMKRRLDLAAALVHNPDVLFLDEPTTGLDPVTRARVWEEVRMLNAELGMTIFLTTQYLEEADALAGRVGIIDHGQIVAEGSPDELKRSIGADVVIARIDGDLEAARKAASEVDGVGRVDAHGHEVSIAVSNGAQAISPIAVALDACGVTVRELTLRTPTLDDVFFEFTGNRILESGSDK